mgnify:CR=1 FL=1
MNIIKRVALVTFSTVSMVALALPASAGSIIIERAWAEWEDNGADIFLTVRNTGDSKDVLYAVKTKIARQAKLEALSEADDRAGRNQTVLSFDIEPGQTLELSEDGPHVELRGVRRRLKEGDTFRATFYFEKAGPVFADVTVEED